MLKTNITPHREFLPADAPKQKLFVMLKLRPTKQAASSRPSTAFVFIIDTSGSMDEVVTGDTHPTGRTYQADRRDWIEVTGGKTKRDIVIASLENLIDSGLLDRNDRLAIAQFDDNASTIIGLTPATEVESLKEAISQLRDFSGGTRIGLGMRQALSTLSNQEMTSRRALIFTDGQAFDEDECREVASEFATSNIPITALGVGDYNEDLLTYLSDTTAGRCFHVVADNVDSDAVSITDLPVKIAEEYSLAQQEVITNLALTIKTVKGVRLTRVVRAYPTLAEFPLNQEPYPIGNAAANDETIFIFELTIDKRPVSRVRIAQLGLTYDIPGQNRRGELPPQDILVEFVAGQIAAQVDPEVMGYMKQCNLYQMIDDATKTAEKDPQRAEEILENVRRMSEEIGNPEMVKSLSNAKEELRKTRKISSETRKTIKMGSKGKTIKMERDINEELSEEEIRNISGT